MRVKTAPILCAVTVLFLSLATGFIHCPAAYAQEKEYFAIEGIEKTARTGDPDAQYATGLIYLNGTEDTPPSPPTAYAWFYAAAMLGHEEAEKERAKLAPQLKGEERKKARELSEHYYRKYVYPYERPFSLLINGKYYLDSVEVKIPDQTIIKIKALHQDPSITTVLMRDPKQPTLSTPLKISNEYRLRNEERILHKGKKSRLEFVAIDDNRQIRNVIQITFVPGP
ncbi:MAG: sel1 repeat family protein [Rhodospirillales bacterium]|nr:sel1 repeat family protein [Rhodospirillales bacterium]